MSTARRFIRRSEEPESATNCRAPKERQSKTLVEVAIGKKMIAVCVVLTVIGSLSPIRVSKASGWVACGTNEVQRENGDGKVIIGPAAANLARGLMGDRRMERGRRFLNNRGFRLNLDDAIAIVGNQGELAVFVPFFRRDEREAYLLYRKKGSKNKVTLFVLYFKSRQAHTQTGPATIAKVGFRRPQEEFEVIEEVVVEEVYVIDDTGIVYDEYEAESTKRVIKCIIAVCSGAALCPLLGPGVLKCIIGVCGMGAISCTVSAILDKIWE